MKPKTSTRLSNSPPRAHCRSSKIITKTVPIDGLGGRFSRDGIRWRGDEDPCEVLGMSALDLFRLDGKTALVTGSKRGIGKAMAIALAEAGADIIGVSRSLEPTVKWNGKFLR